MTLQLYSSAKHELAALQEKIQAIENEIVSEQYDYFLESSGLLPFVNTLKVRNNEVVRPMVTF
jgi:Conserved oligomeric complex COG6